MMIGNTKFGPRKEFYHSGRPECHGKPREVAAGLDIVPGLLKSTANDGGGAPARFMSVAALVDNWPGIFAQLIAGR
jgi:hypothetical protein